MPFLLGVEIQTQRKPYNQAATLHPFQSSIYTYHHHLIIQRKGRHLVWVDKTGIRAILGLCNLL